MTTTYFNQYQWEPFVYQRLNEIIDHNKNYSDAYVVFDFDNTTVIMDIEHNYFIYAIEHLMLYLTTEAFTELLMGGPFDLDQPFSRNRTMKDLALDIIDAYDFLYKNYIVLPNGNKTTEALTEIKKSDAFHDFRAKYRAFYLKASKLYQRQYSEIWMNYLFAGQSTDSFYQNSIDMLDWATDQTFETILFESKTPGRTGYVHSEFESGLHLPQELKALYQAFQENDIATYIISASPIDLVFAANDYFQLNVPREQIIAMEYLTENGKIIPIVKEPSFITKGPGKTEAIIGAIQPKHHHQDPVAVFGDSTGDYNMFIDFNDLQLGVLFNVLSDGATQEIVDQTIASYGQKNAKYVLQGRNEQTGRLRASNRTLAKNADESRVKP